MFYMNVFLIYNIETSCWTIQNTGWSSVLVYPIYVLQCLFAVVDTMTITKKTSKILVFKVMRYHHELPCKLNSVVFELSVCLLFLKSMMMTLWVRFFGEIWIMISDPRSLTLFIKGTVESVTREDLSAPLMHQWSWITDPDPDNPKEMHPLYLLNFLLKKKKNLQLKLLISLGQKLLAMLISTTQHMIHYNIACVLILLCVYLPPPPPNSSICNPIATYLNLIFLCFFIKNTTWWYFTCIYCQLLFLHNISSFLVG